MNELQRESFDLHVTACRRNIKNNFKRKWMRLWWWKLVWNDTLNRVCSSGEPK